jgi:hypothetical protein
MAIAQAAPHGGATFLLDQGEANSHR